ncbi:hypothetical protein NIIDMKKI_49790 [Mycobacterium kansasii]|uniref:Uncharacterized protein n=1 Tax=Mycobacterium kansasii TaxID=1768 RepID=A0A7G1II09_MYCKA|nr:hypothetical protein NIIDMKKI_49790 [Mycobacterium kansasii]
MLSHDQRAPHPAELRQAWLDLHESWLTAKAAEIGITDDSGFAIVGVGGLGRRELLPHSDLDLLLVHDGKPAEVLGRSPTSCGTRCGTPTFGSTTACEPFPTRWLWPIPTWWPPWACWKPVTSPATSDFPTG